MCGEWQNRAFITSQLEIDLILSGLLVVALVKTRVLDGKPAQFQATRYKTPHYVALVWENVVLMKLMRKTAQTVENTKTHFFKTVFSCCCIVGIRIVKRHVPKLSK